MQTYECATVMHAIFKDIGIRVCVHLPYKCAISIALTIALTRKCRLLWGSTTYSDDSFANCHVAEML